MSDQDYKAGEKGVPWSPTMDRGDYDSGKSTRDAKDAIGRTGTGSSTAPPGSGAGAGLILLLPLIPFLYPLAGAAAAGWAYFFFKITNVNMDSGVLHVALVFLPPIAVFFFAKRWEAKFAVRFRFYRYLRMPVRFAAVIAFSALFFAAGDRHGPSQGQYFAGFLVAVFSAIFIFPRLDRWEREDTEA